MTAVETERPAARTGQTGGVGDSASRPDGTLKVTGNFAYSSDLHLSGALWGATLRSPFPRARILSLDTTRALAIPGVAAVLTHEDVPGEKTYGMKVADQPVLAFDEVRYQGEAVAVVAADHPEIARRALDEIVVVYEELQPVVDPELALAGDGGAVHPGGNLVRHVRIRHGDTDEARRRSEVVIDADFEVGTQDPAFLGPESGLAVPDGDGGVDLYVAAQWLHLDQTQVASTLGLPPAMVRLSLGGVGGAFGGREDLSMHVHACMLALRTGRPVRMVYNREESFFGHVRRHPARARVELGATNDGQIVFANVRLLLDGGAYTSTSNVVIANACYFAAGAYQVPDVRIDGYAVFTNNPPSGAMRGFGAVQACYAIESAIDRLADAVGIDPLELRLRNALVEGDVLPTGQAVDGPTPVRELLEHLRDLPLPPERDGELDLRTLPGGLGNVTHGEGIRRGVGYALGMKAIGYSGGVDDYGTARVRLRALNGTAVADVHSAAAECGQGLTTVMAQIVRTELGVDQVVVQQADTSIGDSGSTSASRQTWMTGGAVLAACEAVCGAVLARAAEQLDRPAESLVLRDGRVWDTDDITVNVALADVLGDDVVDEESEFHHRPTGRIDDERGQGDAHIAYAYAAHRAVVDVDTELGLVRVVELATAQDVGKAINPIAVEGQIEGGSAQGLGLALMEEVQIVDGRIRNPSFTDYLIPTILDMPPVNMKVFEYPHPDSPYGLNGVGEPPTLSSTPAIMNALRNATGLDLPRVPVRPADFIPEETTT